MLKGRTPFYGMLKITFIAIIKKTAWNILSKHIKSQVYMLSILDLKFINELKTNFQHIQISFLNKSIL